MIPSEPWSDADDGALNGDGGAEIGFGVDRRRLVTLLVAVLAVLLVVAYLAGRQSTSKAPAGRSAATASGVTASTVGSREIPPGTAAPAAVAVSISDEVADTAAPKLPFGEPTGLVVYLTPTGGAPDSIRAYDVDTGLVHDLSLGGDIGWYIRAIDGAGGVVVDGARAVLLADGESRTIMRGSDGGAVEAPNGRTAQGHDGGLWARGFNPPRLEFFDRLGSSTGVVHELEIGSELYGSKIDGRPVIRREDARLLVIESDGSRSSLADNALSPVEAGRFAEVVCAADQECRVIGHIDGTTVDLGPARDSGGFERRSFRFQPDGPLVAVSVNGQISLIDTTTGTVVPDIARASNQAWFGDDDRMPVRFLPGGRGLVVPTGYGLDLVDPSGTKVTEVSLDMTAGIVLILGVGFAHPWEP